MTHITETELGVSGESIEEIYGKYLKNRYIINRRYQRKLVWGIEEKEKLIDSLCRNLPVPLILIAEAEEEASKAYEIIDGLQRVNAIISFIENEYSYNGMYFDLNAIGATIDKRDSGELVQKEPILNRDMSRTIAEYRLPVSTYRSADSETIDEVFRRINSSGKKLSLQEVRQAGATEMFANMVRVISSEIRGDVTAHQKISLSDAAKIRISQTKDASTPGIYSKDIFWVRNGILNEKEVREGSRDEEFVVDLLLDILYSPEIKGTRKENRDSAYNSSANDDTIKSTLESKISIIGKNEVKERFINVFDVVRIATEISDRTFVDLILPGKSKPVGIPRYYHMVFMAIYNLMYIDGLKNVDHNKLSSILDNIYASKGIFIPSGGGTWAAAKKKDTIKNLKVHLAEAFSEPDGESEDNKRIYTEFENNLKVALMEGEMFELKNGFTLLANSPKINEKIIEDVCRTATAMSNTRTGMDGYIFFGVADKDSAVRRVRNIYGISPMDVNGFSIVGTRHELEHLEYSIDDLHRWVIQKIDSMNIEPSEYKVILKENFKPFTYKDYLIWMLKVPEYNDKVLFDEEYWHREGSSTKPVPHSYMQGFFEKFM